MPNSFSFRNIPHDLEQTFRLLEGLEFKRFKDEQSSEPASQFEKIIKLQDECVHKTSSELKLPLSKLQHHLSSTLRAQEKGRITAEELHHRLLKAEDQCAYLTRLIDELLDLSGETTFSHLKIHPQEVNLCNIAADVIERLMDQALKTKSRIFLDCPCTVTGKLDGTRVDQILTQLITNAIKFAPGSVIEVRICGFGDMATLEVTDHGPGIPFSKQALIFERFTKLDDSSSGFGIGLWLVKCIVERMCGTVSVSSWPGEGSAFTVKLPLKSMLH